MRIGINISSMHSLSRKRGIGKYSQNLVDALKQYTKEEIVLVEDKKDHKLDIEHFPTFDFFRRTLPIIQKNKTVVTVHDVIPLIFPRHYPKGIKGAINLQFQKIALKKVSSIITDSEASKNDISKVFGINKQKIHVVYLAADQSFKKITDQKKLKIVADKYNLPKQFALFVGNVNWNKNLLNMAEACVRAGLDLYLIGGGFNQKDNLNHPELRSYKQFLAKYADNPLIHTLGFVDDQEIVSLYNLAQMALLPSFYEGFGLPILEAQSCGTPVITSNISSMPEVAGNGALLVNPNSVEEIEKNITELKENFTLQGKLIKAGFLNVKEFTWEKTAKNTLKIYLKNN